jgi:uncharacterized membrane protein
MALSGLMRGSLWGAVLAGAACAQAGDGQLPALSTPGLVLIYSVLAAFLVLLLLLIINVLRTMFSRPRPSRPPAAPGPSAGADEPLQILKRRYASGQISKDDYEAMKRDLEA